LYKSRKWTKNSLLKLVSLHGFEVLKEVDESAEELEHLPEPVFGRNGTGFMTLLLRKHTEESWVAKSDKSSSRTLNTL
jgi:hypothetical protein